MSKPASVSSNDSFATWRINFNALLAIAPEVYESAQPGGPTTDDDGVGTALGPFENGTLWIDTNAIPNVAYILVDNSTGAALWIQLGATPGALKDDGTVALSANWDAGSYFIQALRFISDVATGTSPLTVSSTTVCTNLNADLLDGLHAAQLNSVDWTDDTNDSNVTVATGDRRLVKNITANRDRTLPGTFSSTDRDIVIINADDASNVNISPQVGDNIIVNNTDMGSGADYVLPPGQGIIINPSVANTTWVAQTFGLPSNASISLSKLENILAWNIIVRPSASTGAPTATKISSLTEQPSPDAGDWLMGEASTGELRKFDVGNIAPGADSVSNTQLANMAAYTIKMRNAASTGDPSDTKISALTIIDAADGSWVLGEDDSGNLRKIPGSALLVDDFTVKTASFAAVAGRRYYIDTDTGAGSAADVIVSLPTPTAGDIIEVFHVGVGDVNSANEGLELDPGAGYRIQQEALGENLIFNVNQSAVRLVYLNSTYGWRLAVL